jgi:glycosyltransferase involved in cell wall biosynthesis
MKPLKITIVTGAFLPVPSLLGGAVEKMWLALGKEFVRAGHQVTMISRRFPGLSEEEVVEGIHHRRVGGFSSPKNILVLKILDFFYSLSVLPKLPNADILISNTFWLPVLARSSNKGRLLVDVQRMPKGQMRLYGANSILRANSRAVHDAILAEIPEASDRIITIPNPLPFDPPEEVDLKDKESVILYAGRIHPEKGLDLLIESAHLLPAGWKLDVVGPHQISAGGGGEEYLESLKHKAKELPVRFIGPIHDIRKLAERYRRSSLFVYPSIAEAGETFGLAVLEAMSWGCVPIVSDLPCFRDFVTHGTNGLIFDHRGKEAPVRLAELISQLAGSPGQLQKLALRTLDVRRTHSPQRVSRSFVEAFGQMVGLHQGSYSS